jgi:hypothetical protein
VQRSSYRRWAVVRVLLCSALIACSNEITSVQPTPGLSLTTTSASLSLTEGERLPIDVQINRTGGFAGPVTLTVTGLPAHVTVVGVENPVAGNNASVELAVGPDVITGDYALTVTATGAGIQPHTLPIALHILTPVPFQVNVVYCTIAAPSWVAFQDGNREFTRILPVVNGSSTIFRHLFTTNRGAIATLGSALDGALTSLNILFGTPAELADAGDTNPLDCSGTQAKTLFGDVAGIGANESALVSSGLFLRSPVRQTEPATFTLTGLAGGLQDLLATRTTGLAGTAEVTRLILRRGIDVPDSTRIPLLDFESAEAFAPVIANVSIAGLAGQNAIGETTLLTSRSAMVLSSLTNQRNAATRPYFALPQGRLLGSEVQGLRVTTDAASPSRRSADVYFRSPVDRLVTLGAPVVAPVISSATATPSAQVRARFVGQAAYDRVTFINYQQGSSSALVSVGMTPAYAAASGAGYDLVVPDLTGVAGFDPAWTLRPGVKLLWSAVRIGGTLGFGRNVVPIDGATRRDAFLQDTITVH